MTAAAPRDLPDPADRPWPRMTQQTSLRLLEFGDVDAMHAYRRLPEVCAHLAHRPLTREEVELRVRYRLSGADPTAGRLVRGVAVVVEDRVVGDAMLRVQRGEDGTPELWIGYALHPDVWGRGIATEVAQELRAVGAEMGLVVKADAFTDNTASHRVLEKAGLVVCGDGVHQGRPMLLFTTPTP